MYYATFHSNLIYAIQIYSCTNKSNLLPLVKKQKAAVRIVNNSKYNDHSEPIFKSLRILPLPLLCDFFKLQFMQRFLQGFLPQSFNNTWTTNRIRHDNQPEIELRNDDDIFIPYARTNLISNQPLVSFPRLWETFPAGEIKFLRNKLEFNEKLKEYFLSTLNSTIVCTRLFCPTCANR